MFSDFSLNENTFSISHVDLFRKMDSLNVDSVSVVWQVYALGSIDSVFSVNGPYHLHISKDSVNIDIPSIYLQIEDSLFSRNMDIETKMIHIYEDSLQLTMDFSIDQGESWTNEFKIDTLQNIVDINYSVFWVIKDAQKFLFNIQSPVETVKATSETAMREVIAKSDIQPILTEGRSNIEIEVAEITANQEVQMVNNYLEKSNVNPVEELILTLEHQRNYETHVKFIDLAKQMDEGGASLMRVPD